MLNGQQSELVELQKDLKRVRADIAALTEGMNREGKKQFRLLKKQMKKSAKSGLESLRGTVNGVAEGGQEALETIQEQFESRPLMAALSAIGIGFMLGKLFGRVQ